MKKLIFCLMMLLPIGAVAENFIVTEAQFVVITGNTLDTLGRTMITPDSIRIVVTDSAGTELFDAWFEDADAQCTLNGDVITFFDQWEDINGAADFGTFSIMATIASDADNNIDVYSNQNYTLRGVVTTTEATYADVVSILAEVVNIDAWNPITDNDSLIIDQSTTVKTGYALSVAGIDAIADTVLDRNLSDTVNNSIFAKIMRDASAASAQAIANNTAIGVVQDTVDGIIDTLQNQDDWVGREATLTDIGDTLEWVYRSRIVGISNVDADAAPTTTGFTSSAFTEADDYWIGNQVMFVEGTIAGQIARIVDFTASVDSFTVTPAFSAAPAVSDSFIILATLGETVTASVSDADMGAIADSIWTYDSASFAGAATAGILLARGYDTTLGVIDTLQRFTEQQTDTLQAVIDSIQNLATLSDVADSSYGRKIVKRGIVKTLPDVSGFSSTVFTEADDYWIDNLIEMRDGTAVGQITRISDFTAATDSATFSPSFSVEPAIGDSFYVLAAFSESPSAGGGLDTLSTVFVDRLTGRVADTTWLSSLEARDGTAGSFGDSAQGWGATSAGGTDTTNIKLMMANNPEITSGYQVSYRGSVADASPTNGRVIVDGINLGAADDFYNDMVLIWFFGALAGESQPITDWKTTQDSLITRTFSAAPADNDSFVIIPTNFANAYALSGDTTAADNLAEAFDGDATGSAMRLTNLRIETSTADDTAMFVSATGTGASPGLIVNSTNAQGVIFVSQAGGGFQGFLAQGGVGAEFVGTAQSGLEASGSGSSPGILAIGSTSGAGGDGMTLAGGGSAGVGLGLSSVSASLIEDNAITAATIATDAIGSAEFAATAVNEIADTVWTADTTGNKTATGFGRILGAVLDTLNLQDDWVAQNANFDTLLYIGEHGLGIFIDSTAGNTNTVIGVDGRENNPVSTLAAGRTLALALGSHRFYLHGGSTFNGAGTDLGADYSAWEFYGEGHGIELAFGGQLVTNSFFHNITLSGAMHASAGNALFQDCEIGFVSANFNGVLQSCLLTDTIVIKANRDIEILDCWSGVAGMETPTINFSAGSSILNVRNYSGGLRFMNAASNDTVSIELDGQVVISANNTSLAITVRGMASITDSGTTTVLTQDAVWNRGSVDTVFIPATVDSNWNELVADHQIVLTYGDTLIQTQTLTRDTVFATIDTLQRFTERQTDSLQAVLDTLQNQDDWVARQDTLLWVYRSRISGIGNVDAGSVPTTTGFTSSNFTEADDYWNENQVMFVEGAIAGQVARITDFTAATDSFTVSPAFSVAPAVEDSFIVLANLGEAGGGGSGLDTLQTVFVDRLTTRIADSIWLSLLEARDGTAGSFGDSSQGWGATAAGGTDTLNIKTMMERNFTSASGGDGWANMLADSTWLLDTTGNKIATGFGNILGKINDTAEAQDDWVLAKGDSAEYMNTKSMGGVANTASPVNIDEAFNDDGVGSDMDLNSLHILATGTNDTGVVIRGDGSGAGSFIAGGATGIGSVIEGGATSGDGVNITATDGHGMDISSGGAANHGIKTAGAGVGDGFRSLGGITGNGMQLEGGSTSGDVFALTTTGSGDFITLAARQELASTIADSNWLSLLEARDGVAGSFGDSSQGWGAAGSNDTLLTAFVDRLTTRISDSVWLSLLEARDGVAGSFGDSSQGWGTQADFTQIPGADVSMTYRAIDTATSTAIQGVSVSAYNKSDVRVAFGTTNGSGQVIFGFKLNDTVYFNSTNPVDFVWTQRDTIFGVTNGLIDTTEGFQFSGDAPASGKTAAVSIFVTNNDRTPAINVQVSAYLSRSNVVDSAGFPVYNQTQTFFTDSDGKVTFTCIWSSYMIPATKWYFSTSVPGTIKKKITIPRETSLTLDLR